MSKLYTSGYKPKNVNIIHKSLNGYKCQHYTLVAKYVDTIHKWLKC